MNISSALRTECAGLEELIPIVFASRSPLLVRKKTVDGLQPQVCFLVLPVSVDGFKALKRWFGLFEQLSDCR